MVGTVGGELDKTGELELSTSKWTLMHLFLLALDGRCDTARLLLALAVVTSPQ